MPDNHIKRGFLDDSRLDNVSVRSHDKSTAIGSIMTSQKERHTETAGDELYENGKPHEATDTQGEWKAAGLVQCKRCGIAQGEGTPEDAKDFRFYKKDGSWYRCLNCKNCETEMQRTRRFSHVIPIDPYPKRIN